MKLIADSGSTKTDWLLKSDDTIVKQFRTKGCNPCIMPEHDIYTLFASEVIDGVAPYSPDEISEIEFYGAGCIKEKSPVVADIISRLFCNTRHIIVESDMLGAAKALCGNGEGIACILGTGANSCLYDGEKIIANTPAMGFILGDEGSGAVLGRSFINALYKGAHQDFIPVFENATGLSLPAIIQNVYRESMPNRFLASLAPFIKEHIAESWISALVTKCFQSFFVNNISHYQRPDLSVNFVGSIAYYFESQLREAAGNEGYMIGKIMKSPIETL